MFTIYAAVLVLTNHRMKRSRKCLGLNLYSQHTRTAQLNFRIWAHKFVEGPITHKS